MEANASLFREAQDIADFATQLPDAVLVISEVGELLWGNRAAERLFGLTIGEALGRNVLEFVHPDDAEVATVAVTSVQAKETGTLLEVRVRCIDEWRLVEVRGVALDDGILLAIRDITERRRWEIAGDETARFRTLIQNGASVTLLLSAQRTIIASSSVITRVLGHDQEWLEGRRLDDIVDERDHALLTDVWTPVCSSTTATPTRIDLRLRSATGDVVPFAMTLTNLLDDPTLQGVVANGHDVCDRVKAEQALRDANSLLTTTLEATADGVLVVDEAGRVTTFNRRFAELWQLPDGDEQPEYDAALAMMLDQLAEPEAFLAKADEAGATPTAHTYDVVHFKDGRILERLSRPRRVGDTIVGRVWTFHDITEQETLKRELGHQALHDALTGLANQVLLRDRIDHGVARLARTGRCVAVLFIDLDNFKYVNDTLGHWAGDSLLVQVSERLRSAIRAADTAARLGGDEFVVLVDDLDDEAAALRIADRIVAAIREPIVIANRELTITASIGVAIGTRNANSDELLRNADLAMYAAKSAGKNRVRSYSPQMHASAVDHVELEARIRVGIRRGEFDMHYQPIIGLRTGSVTAVEGLARWQHPERGTVYPHDFIPFAEENGLIADLGNQLLDVACRQASAWVSRFGSRAPALSVNLSPCQLHSSGLVPLIDSLLRTHRVDPTRLILEITEGALITDPERASATLSQLHAMGVRLAVDDFGTGYSSLGYLQRFPIDILKIDRVFVQRVTDDNERSLTRAIIELAHSLGLTPIAEGVEEPEQLELLRRYGCDLAQGYLLGRPVAATEVEAILAAEERPVLVASSERAAG